MIRRIGLTALVLGLVAVIGFVIWAENPMPAESRPLSAVKADSQLTYSDTDSSVVLTPRDPNGAGLIFVAGARVDAPAYAATLRGVADAGVTVVIVRPILNFAIFEFRPLKSFESAAPDVTRWYVGGHSLGGVKACQWAAEPKVAGLVLLGSYCANDLSRTDIPVLSIGGTRDGLSTPAKIAAARDLLPSDARLIEIRGASHAQFGAYGSQPGDGTPTVPDSTVTAAIVRDMLDFVGGTATG